MIISKNSQLGLMDWDRDMMLEFLDDSKSFLQKEHDFISNKIETIKVKGEITQYDLGYVRNDGDATYDDICKKLGYNPENKGSEFYTARHPNPKMYLIMNSVEKCSELIRINENFSCCVFNKIKDGEHVYLLGKNQFYRFVKFNGGIRASFWDREKHEAFEFGFDLDKDKYYFPTLEKAEFNRLVRLMTFIELGDIAVKILESGRNNGSKNKQNKITNTSNNTVYVVDSSWNQIIIRMRGSPLEVFLDYSLVELIIQIES